MIPPEELEITCERPNPGGQHVGAYSGVQVKHLPTGITARVEGSRSQHRNKMVAVEMIEAALTSPNFRG